jgi:hypothetical protein
MKKQFAVLLILLLIPASLVGQTRIRFKKGKSSATVTGTLAKGGGKCYVLGAREGQSIDARLRARRGKVQFMFVFGAGPYKGGTSYSTTAVDGDNEICIENYYRNRISTYSLTVSIR